MTPFCNLPSKISVSSVHKCIRTNGQEQGLNQAGAISWYRQWTRESTENKMPSGVIKHFMRALNKTDDT